MKGTGLQQDIADEHVLLRYGGVFLTLSGLQLAGPQSRYGILDGSALLVRELCPADWHGWLRLDASQCANRWLHLPEDLAQSAHQVLRFVGRNEDRDHVCQIITLWLEESIARRRPGEDEAEILVIKRALCSPEIRDTGDLCRMTGLNHARLAKLCKRHFGFPPKLLICRERFLRSFAMIRDVPRGFWADSIDLAYVDQSHFIRDSQRFLGTSPTRFILDQARISQGHVMPTSVAA